MQRILFSEAGCCNIPISLKTPQRNLSTTNRHRSAIIDGMEIWTGLVCLVPDPACKNFRRFGEGKGAYVNVVAWAESAKQFEQRVMASAEELDCIIREMEKIELLDSVLEREECPEEVFTMRATAERQPNDVVFGTFHIWAEEDVN